ncbi:MAG: helix-hairpin-helix domain-containing protein [Peptococcaceae bacterium]|nr:MAG: helix-hairpin-helix domain-containing protein [Peptococcaceae bacterium]
MKMVKVTLTGSYGYKAPGQSRKYYGPGLDIEVPEGLAMALGLPVSDSAPVQKPAPDPSFQNVPLPLPEAIPARAFLLEAGLDTVDKLREKRISDLTKIKGIGQATAKNIIKIVEAL